jgi:hypothetical protein
MVIVHTIHYWAVDSSEYTDGRYVDRGKEYTMSLPHGLSTSRPVLEQHTGGGNIRRIVLDGSQDFPTLEEAQQFADACNKSESWGR